MSALVLTRREDEGAVLRLDLDMVIMLQAIALRVHDDAHMIAALEELIAFKGEIVVSKIASPQVRLAFKDFPLYVKIFRSEVDKRIQEEESNPQLF